MRMVIMALALALTVSASAPAPVEGAGQLYQAVTAGVRWARGDRLPVNSALYRVAARRAIALAKAGAFDDHAGFIPSTGSLYGKWARVGEIVGWNNRSTRARWFIEAWLASSTHRAVLLGRWRAHGASCARNATQVYCVVIFGR